jgi:hypothetical protein
LKNILANINQNIVPFKSGKEILQEYKNEKQIPQTKEDKDIIDEIITEYKTPNPAIRELDPLP